MEIRPSMTVRPSAWPQIPVAEEGVAPLPPLSLYVHIPWCQRKCPYCDFNSHPLTGALPERLYVDALLGDLDQELPLIGERPLVSLFIGGGTPSLLSGMAVQRLLDGIRARVPLVPDAEISLEANPGTAEAGRFADYRAAGINRLSLGAQSFQAPQLAALGRIHGPAEARQAVTLARQSGFDNLNLDLMFGLPGQNLESARRDLEEALAFAPEHLSYYQLTLEPHTRFAADPPPLPDEDRVWDMQQQGKALLSSGGLRQYEVSAHARPGHACVHNLGYWTFGDYLGLGAGAHGKLSLADGSLWRRWKRPQPAAYLAGATSGAFLAGHQRLTARELPVEFLMNALRLNQGFPRALFEARTGLSWTVLEAGMTRARELGLIREEADLVRPTALGRRFLDDLLALFVAR